MSAADRLARHRARRKAGKAVLRVEVELHELADALADGGFLKAWDSENVEAIRQATETMIAALIRVSNLRNVEE
jgi:hypothetical protein